MSCEIHLAGGDKNNPICTRQCKKRIAYADGLDPENLTARRFGGDGAVHLGGIEVALPSAPVGLSYVARPRRKKMEETKTCSRCGKELPLDRFEKHAKTADGYQKMCSACHSKSMREYWASKKKEGPSERQQKKNRSRSRRGERKPSAAPAVTESNGNQLLVDFSGCPHLLDRLRKQAESEFRTVENQVLWLISEQLPVCDFEFKLTDE